MTNYKDKVYNKYILNLRSKSARRSYGPKKAQLRHF